MEYRSKKYNPFKKVRFVGLLLRKEFSGNVQKKYELTSETMEWYEKTLHRIRALKDIPRYGIKKGQLGGWVQSEDNLAQRGDCWIGDEAMVYDNAKVFGHASASNAARVYDCAQVYGHAKVCEFADISGDARVFGKACVSGEAWVSENACVSGEARVFGCAELGYGTYRSGEWY